MGALSRPGPQMGAKEPPRALTREGRAEPFGSWFWAFLRDELRPYPGRWALVLRMTLAATLTMLAIMTFRLPGAAIAAYYTLLLSRETPLHTVRAAATVMLMYVLGVAYALLGVLLFVDYPLTHFVWVMASVFVCFYVIKVTTDYVAGAAFAFIITIAIPIWDTSAPTADLGQLRGLRDRISANFATVNSQADAVLFEVGPQRGRDLRLRERLLSWQPRLRSFFLLEVGLLQYRAKIDPRELAPEVLAAQQAFDRRASGILSEMAEAFEGRPSAMGEGGMRDVFPPLEHAVREAYHDQLPPRAQGVLVFSSNMAKVLDRLRTELAEHLG